MSKCDINKIEVGDIFSRHSYGSIIQKERGSIKVKNEEGYEWTVSNDIVEKEFSFSGQIVEEKEVTRTEIIEIFKMHPRFALSVNFNKKVNAPDVKKALYELYPNKGQILSEANFKKAVNAAVSSALVGEERTMIGYHTSAVDNTGRIIFTDMKASDGRPRQVDPRTINWLIVDNIKYTVRD